MNLNRCFLISQNISTDLKGPKVKYKLHYGRCTRPLFRDAARHNTSYSDNKINKNIIMSSFKSSRDIQKKEGGHKPRFEVRGILFWFYRVQHTND